MCFTPNRGQMPNLILQNMLVLKYIVEGARITLQPNTPKWSANLGYQSRETIELHSNKSCFFCFDTQLCALMNFNINGRPKYTFRTSMQLAPPGKTRIDCCCMLLEHQNLFLLLGYKAIHLNFWERWFLIQYQSLHNQVVQSLIIAAPILLKTIS